MTWIPFFIRDVCLALWVGGLFAIDVIEAPLRIRTIDVPREHSTAIGTRVFRVFGWTQLCIGLVILIEFFVWPSVTSNAVGRGARFPTIIVLAMFVTTLVQSIYLLPRAAKLRSLLYSKSEQFNRNLFNTVHGIYIGLDFAKLAGGIWLLSFLSRTLIYK